MTQPDMFVHSCYVRKDDSDALVIKTSNYDDSGNIIGKLEVIQNPKRSYWLTKPRYRTHSFKKECARMDELDRYTVYNKDMVKDIYKNLYGKYPHGYLRLRELCDSPYIYGADVDISTLVKQRYTELYGETEPIPYTVGFLDIETSMISTDEDIILITVTHQNHVYTAIHRSYLYENVDPAKPNAPRVKATIESVDRVVQSTLAEHIKKYDLHISYFIGDNEVELITWIYQQVHKHKTDFVGIWNMDFDMPKILQALGKANVDPADILCPKEVPSQYRYVKYHQDARANVQHFTERWHWLYCTGYTQMTDSQNLYSRLRKVKGHKESYALNVILQEECKLNKLSLGPEGSHYVMQRDRFVDYIAYNIFDAVGLYIMELQNSDHQTMGILAGISPLDQFAYQTKLLSNMFYTYCLKNNRVPASVGAHMTNEYTDLILKAKGGTVLNPERSINTGANAILERPNYETMLTPHVFDLDFSAQYPNAGMAGNISIETKQSSIIGIDGDTDPDKISDLCSNLLSPKENGVYLGKTYFNLPGYREMDEIFSSITQ